MSKSAYILPVPLHYFCSIFAVFLSLVFRAQPTAKHYQHSSPSTGGNFHDKILWDWWEQWCFLGCSPLQSDQGDWIGSPTRPLLISPASQYPMLPSGVISKRYSNKSPVGKFMHSSNINIVIIAIGSSLHVLWTVIISHNFLRTVLSFLHFFVERLHSSCCHYSWPFYKYNNSGSLYWIKTVHFVNFTWYSWVVRKLLIYHSFGHLCTIGVYYKVQC